jgi:hypothetical protein
MKSGKTIPQTRRAWVPPSITKLAIGTETRSAGESKQGARSGSSGAGPSALAEPQPPAAPETKLGFSVEWAFPLSARWED